MTVAGHNVAGDLLYATVFYAQPIDTSSIQPINGVTIIASSYIAGTLKGIGTQGFWSISMVYDFKDGKRYNDLFLLFSLDQTTEDALMAWAGLAVYNSAPGNDPQQQQACVDACNTSFDACMTAATSSLLACNSSAAERYDLCLVAALAGGAAGFTVHPGLGILVGGAGLWLCSKAKYHALKACKATYKGATGLCYAA